MSLNTKSLTRDLLEGASQSRRNLAAFLVLAAAAFLALVTSDSSGVLFVYPAFAAVALCFVALRIQGPQDAKSFRLYRGSASGAAL